MKAIHYDTEGDILTITFGDAASGQQRGIELSENITLYYNPETEEPLCLILISYQAMLHASSKNPIVLDGLERAPETVQKIIQKLLKRTPLATFFEISPIVNGSPTTSRLHEIFTPAALELVTA